MRLAGTAVVRNWQDEHRYLLRCVWDIPCPNTVRPMHHYTCDAFRQLPMDIAIGPESNYPGLGEVRGGPTDRVSGRLPIQGSPYEDGYPEVGAYTGRTSRPPVIDGYNDGIDDIGDSGVHSMRYRRTRHRTTTRRVRRSSTGSTLGEERISTFTGIREETRQSLCAEPVGLDRHWNRTAAVGARGIYRSAEVPSGAGPGGAYYHSRQTARASTNRTSYREPTGGREGARYGPALGSWHRTTHGRLYH